MNITLIEIKKSDINGYIFDILNINDKSLFLFNFCEEWGYMNIFFFEIYLWGNNYTK